MRAFRSFKPRAAVIALLSLSFVSPTFAEITPAEQKEIFVAVTQLLEQRALRTRKIDDDASAAVFDTIIDRFDPKHIYLYQSDIDRLRRAYARVLDDELRNGENTFVEALHGLFLERAAAHLSLAEELLAAGFDFSTDEYLEPYSDFARSEEELRERWRKTLKSEMLRERLVPHPVEPTQQVAGVLAGYRERIVEWRDTTRADLAEVFLGAWARHFDPHTEYFNPSTLKRFRINNGERIEGIGASLRRKEGKHRVVEILPGGPAAKHGGLVVGDTVLAISSTGAEDALVEISETSENEISELLWGKSGTPVLLRVQKTSGAIESYSITRGRIFAASALAKGDVLGFGEKPEGGPFRIGIIDVPSFYLDTEAFERGERYTSVSGDVRKLIVSFREKGIDGLVLDLRLNGGGYLNEAINLADLFLSEGPLVQVRRRGTETKVYTDNDGGRVSYDGPLVVLVSDRTASASEIFAAAIQDYRRGIIVGSESTYGKYSVQGLFNLDEWLAQRPPVLAPRRPASDRLGALKLTERLYFRVNGRRVPVRSDVSVPMPKLSRDKETDFPVDNPSPVTVHRWEGSLSDEELAELRRLSERRRDGSPFFRRLETAIEVGSGNTDARQSLNEERRREERREKPEPPPYNLHFYVEGPDGEPVFAGKNLDFLNEEMLRIAVDYFTLLRDDE